MLLETQSFEFGEFALDAKEKVLYRNGKPVQVTPKAVSLLLVLVENHGRLVEKDDVMRQVWAGNFVEEGNITFTIGLLRKTLGDTAQNSRFIETVPRRGYRFIHAVQEIAADAEIKPSLSAEHATENRKPRTAFVFAIITILVVASVIFGGWLLKGVDEKAGKVPVLSLPFNLEKISTNGRVFQVVISPDGKNAIFTNGLRGEKQSVWLRQLNSGTNIEIIPPSDDIYLGLAVSPDGNLIYFSRVPKNAENQAAIYQISIFGGVPEKIVSETQGWLSISPDGTKVSYVRCNYREREHCSLWIADSKDGKNEKMVASRSAPFRIGGNKFSPDGKKIAFAAGQSNNQANDFSLMEVDIETGVENEVTAEKFFNIKSLEWLPDGSGLLLTASRIPNKNFRIWQVSTVSGTAESLTKDSENYAALSMSKTGDRLVSTRVRDEFRLRLLEMQNPSANRILANATNAAFALSGKLYFTSALSGNEEIWAINADGSEQRQLTNNTADENRPAISADGNLIFFVSNRTGAAHVWQMDADGGNQKQITQKEGGFPLFISPDNNWVYYHHGINRTLWRVSLHDFVEEQVFDQAKYRFAVSPDGTQAAFSQQHGEEKSISVISLNDGKIVRSFEYPDSHLRMPELVWMPDGKALAYILTDGEFKNNTLWLQQLDGKPPEKIAGLGDEEISEAGGFAVSPNGNDFVVAQGGWRHDAVLITGIK